MKPSLYVKVLWGKNKDKEFHFVKKNSNAQDFQFFINQFAKKEEDIFVNMNDCCCLK